MEMTTMMKQEQQSHQEIQNPQLKTQEIKKQEMDQLSLQEQLKPHQWDSPWMSIQVSCSLIISLSLPHTHTMDFTFCSVKTVNCGNHRAESCAKCPERGHSSKKDDWHEEVRDETYCKRHKGPKG